MTTKNAAGTKRKTAAARKVYDERIEVRPDNFVPATAALNDRGGITIPARLRRVLGLKHKSLVDIQIEQTDEGFRMVLTPVEVVPQRGLMLDQTEMDELLRATRDVDTKHRRRETRIDPDADADGDRAGAMVELKPDAQLAEPAGA